MSFLTRSSPTPLFPSYLLPPIPFRRKRRSTTTTSSPPTPSPISPPYLSGHISQLRCSRCATDLCLTSQIISKGFTGRHGRAYLVSPPSPASPSFSNHSSVTTTGGSSNGSHPNLPNTHIHKPVPRQLVTGSHMVCDVSCVFCGSVLGWKYEAAEEESQRYKIGKVILEAKKVFESCCWEGVPERSDGLEAKRINEGRTDEGWEEDGRKGGEGGEGETAVEFDSQDEDECEDLFAGVWSPALALRRRQRKDLKFARRRT